MNTAAFIEHTNLSPVLTIKDEKNFACACWYKGFWGIRTREQAIAMIDAGATRIGTSSGPAIVGLNNP